MKQILQHFTEPGLYFMVIFLSGGSCKNHGSNFASGLSYQSPLRWGTWPLELWQNSAPSLFHFTSDSPHTFSSLQCKTQEFFTASCQMIAFPSSWKEMIDSLVQSQRFFTNLSFKPGVVWTFQQLVVIKSLLQPIGLVICTAVPYQIAGACSTARNLPLHLLMVTVACSPACTLALKDQQILHIPDCGRKTKIQNPYKFFVHNDHGPKHLCVSFINSSAEWVIWVFFHLCL